MPKEPQQTVDPHVKESELHHDVNNVEDQHEPGQRAQGPVQNEERDDRYDELLKVHHENDHETTARYLQLKPSKTKPRRNQNRECGPIAKPGGAHTSMSE